MPSGKGEKPTVSVDSERAGDRTRPTRIRTPAAPDAELLRKASTHAIDQEAVTFYAPYGFRQVDSDPLGLYRPMKDMKQHSPVERTCMVSTPGACTVACRSDCARVTASSGVASRCVGKSCSQGRLNERECRREVGQLTRDRTSAAGFSLVAHLPAGSR